MDLYKCSRPEWVHFSKSNVAHVFVYQFFNAQNFPKFWGIFFNAQIDTEMEIKKTLTNSILIIFLTPKNEVIFENFA